MLKKSPVETAGGLPRGQKFYALPESLLDPGVPKKLLPIFESKARPHLIPLADKIDPKLIRRQKFNYAEKLGKAMRVKTLRLDNPKAEKIWKSLNIESHISPEAARKLCESIFGKKLHPDHGRQLVCYGKGDYFGPHNDHHPEIAHMRNGYVDFHYYISSPGVVEQNLVHEHKGHLNKMYSIARPFGLNIYKLPLWHYTTPLAVNSKAGKNPSRWIVMYTFYFAENFGRRK